MKVLKFGGTSVGSIENIKKVIQILKDRSVQDRLVVVVSAVGGMTDKLLELADLAIQKNDAYKNGFENLKEVHLEMVRELIDSNRQQLVETAVSEHLSALIQLLDGLYLTNELSPKITDRLLSFGELLSSTIISEALKSNGVDTILKNSQELIKTDASYTNAAVNFDLTEKKIRTFFDENDHRVSLLPGFVSTSESGEITTLGRGGSDYTAAILAAALDASELQIWTDVSGMYTTNPKLVKQAKPIQRITYQEAVELSHFGAKVLYPPTVQPVLDKHIPIAIKNTMAPDDEGTLITDVSENGTDSIVKGISNINDIALLTLQGNGMVGIPGFSKRLFETLAQEKINVILITQASSEHSICFGITESDGKTAEQAINKTFENEIALHKLDPIIVEGGLSIVATVGNNMKNLQGLSGKMFSALGKNNVNIRAIAQGASERNISAVIDKKDVKKALNVLHERFFEVKTKQLNLFITGVGNVGERLIEQISRQKKFVKDNFKINLRVIGLSNSRTMIFSDDGLSLKSWKADLVNGESASLQGFFDQVKAFNLRNSLFVDVTANEAVSDFYSKYIKESISVIACNKIACSSNYDNYLELKQLSRKYNAAFLYETNVGAGLPIIDTLNHLITSGDRINTIKAVLSGSLNFVFNNFNDKTKFHDVVKQAQDEGYTEPDPRIDLSGIDVARKILILARESGVEMNLEDIQCAGFLNDSAMKANSVAEFYDTLIADESYYQELYASAEKNNCRLKFVAEFSAGKAKVGLEEIPLGHPFYNLEGKDNIVMFYTDRYNEQPLIIKGAGAGADVTASGLFADIMRVANN